VAGGDFGQPPDRGVHRRPGRGRGRFRRSSARRGPHRGRNHRRAEWFALRQRVSWLWIPATTAGMAVGLVAGAALVDYGIDRGDLALMGAVNGVAVGVMQALVLARHRIPGAFSWAVANPPAWALGWFVSSYVIARNIDERFPIFGASGAIVFGLLTSSPPSDPGWQRPHLHGLGYRLHDGATKSDAIG
jgi:hypothetical protein